VIALLTLPFGKPAIFQQVTSPFVYLDHFAVMEIARRHRKRFAGALKRAGGTWGLSWVNFLEFATTDEREAALAERLMAAVLPNIVFVEVESLVVSLREDKALLKPFATNPSIHEELAVIYARYSWGKSLDPLSPEGFVRTWREPDLKAALLRILEGATEQMVSMVEETRRRRLTEAQVRRNLEVSLRRKLGIPKAATLRVPPTRFVALEAIRHMIVESINLSDGHHLRDYWHTVVPISYCDFVVLDKHWYRVAVGIQKRLRRERMLTHHARVFRSLTGIEELLRSLESVARRRAREQRRLGKGEANGKR
jgi:hypothetical protein